MLALLIATAHAGRLPFTAVQDVEVIPARIVELQGIVDERAGSPDRTTDDTTFAWGAVIGLSPTVELTLDSELAYQRAANRTAFTWYGAKLRWRLARPGPPPPPGRIVPLVRLDVERFPALDLVVGGVDLVAAVDPVEHVHTSTMVGIRTVNSFDTAALHAGTGVLGDVTPALRAGAEFDLDVPIGPSPGWNFVSDHPTFAAGPTLSLSQGPVWVTVGGLVGLGGQRAYDGRFHLAWGVEM